MEHLSTESTDAGDSVVPLDSSADTASHERLVFLWEVHKYMNQYVGFSDSRATMTLVVASSVTGALYQTKLHHAFISGTPGQSLALEAFASAAAFVFLFLGILCCVLAVIPRLKKPSAAGLVYWDGVLQHGSDKQFWQYLRSQSACDMAAHLAHQVYILAGIATRKYMLLHRGMWLAFAGGMLGVLVLIFR